MLRASVTALRPSFAILMVSKLSSFSALRSCVASMMLLAMASAASVRSAISVSNSSFLASRPCTSEFRVSVSSHRYWRFFLSFPSSSSQKPFFVASDVASSRRRSISLWMRVFTFRKGSSPARAAREEIATLPRRPPSRRSSSSARPRRCSCAEAPDEPAASPPVRRPAAPRALRSEPAMPSCRSERLRPIPASAIVAGGARCCNWRRARLLTAVAEVTFARRISNASASAVNSSLRSCVRWSQSAARCWQRAVRSVM
mmetsp:Transcript_70932/g.195910  ORF Transcript_70932/g.195910 Transcript_70932/m.195910 type:complete len:258 (+) Transcript_70932:395-1168(+)